MSLDPGPIDDLLSLIRDSFRVRPNQDPIYVDIGNHLGRVRAPQFQIIFGRRGSGKSCLLVHTHNRAAANHAESIYVDTDEVKRLPYPDLLIRLVMTILEGLPFERRTLWAWLRRKPHPVRHQLQELRELLDTPIEAAVTEERSKARGQSLGGRAQTGPLGATVSRKRDESSGRSSQFTEEKLQVLERHLKDYKDVLRTSLAESGSQRLSITLDDFYLIHPSVQPDVIDYLHRLTRGTDAYLKIGTVRHRTSLVRYDSGQTIGVEPTQDVEPIDLDQTFEDIDRTRTYLAQLLDSMGKQVGIESATSQFLSPDGLFALTLASGGVPRDYLTIFVEAVEGARAEGKTKWLTPTAIYKGAARVSYRTKLNGLRNDAGTDAVILEQVFQDLLQFCLVEKKKTAFLIGQEDAVQREEEHDFINQLMDFKLIHIIEPDTSAASGRPGRFEAYTLDFALFMEPRKRGIEHVEFWKLDEKQRRQGLREAPAYPLERVSQAWKSRILRQTEEVVEALEDELSLEET